jgi:excinuclease UvrABC ATPase subunit
VPGEGGQFVNAPTLQSADPPTGIRGADGILVIGARENNLRDVTVTIPKNKITVFVGVSGSGKSSLVFDTVAIEAQRQLNASFPWNIRHDLPKYERPHVEAVKYLNTPIVVDQRPLGGNARSTVGTSTDLYSVLRVLFSNHGENALGHPYLYSFNDPKGMCTHCQGLGRTRRPDPDRMLDRTKSINDGAILLPGFGVGTQSWQFYANREGLDPSKPIADFTAEELDLFLYGTTGSVEISFTTGITQKLKYEGLVTAFGRRNVTRDDGMVSDKARADADRFVTDQLCPECDGARLNPEALRTVIDGRTISDWCRMQISDLLEVVTKYSGDASEQLVDTIREGLERICGIGLGYLSLDRSTRTLSGGEGQRLKLVKHLGSDLVGIMYIFDEPSVGLHPRDVGRLNDLLRELRDQGNTVLVVEHDPDVMAIADHVIEVGPKAGVHGGEIVYQGSFAALRERQTITGRGLDRPGVVKAAHRRPTGQLPLRDVTVNNLRNVSVDIPKGVLTAVTGVAGAGKSSLIATAFRDRYPDAIYVDQAPIQRSARATPASYLGLMDPVRKLFAKANGVDAALFSFNSKGACEECGGRGVLVTEIAYMDPVTTHCESCGGRRFRDSVLRHRVRGKSVADVLEMSADEAASFFTEPAVRARCRALVDTGLGYIGLGQSLSTLSGGERQRIKLADRLSGRGNVYILDEPTTGLHISDIDMLLNLLNGIVDRGNTMVVIEHNLAVVAQADWVIDLGPEGGKTGGEIIFTGTPTELLADTRSVTGEYLRIYRTA